MLVDAHAVLRLTPTGGSTIADLLALAIERGLADLTTVGEDGVLEISMSLPGVEV